MSPNLFESFLGSPAQYAQMICYWENLWDGVVGEARSQWQAPWLATSFADGTPFADGNPIFTAVNRKVNRAVRVVQVPPSQRSLELAFWVDYFGSASDTDSVTELVLRCALSDEVVLDVTRILTSWVHTGTVKVAVEYRAPMVMLDQLLAAA